MELPAINQFNKRYKVKIGERLVSSGLLHAVAVKGLLVLKLNDNFMLEIQSEGKFTKFELIAVGNTVKYKSYNYYAPKKEQIKKEEVKFEEQQEVLF